MDATTRTSLSRNFLQGSSHQQLSFLHSTASSHINASPVPSNLPQSEKLRPAQFSNLSSRALPTPPSSDVGTANCGCADDSASAFLRHTSIVRRPSLSPRASSEHHEWPSTSPHRALLTPPTPRCYNLNESTTLNQSLASYTFPFTGSSNLPNPVISITHHSTSSNEMDFTSPPPYRRTPPPMEHLTEALAEHAYNLSTAARRPSASPLDSECRTPLGLGLTTHYLPTPSVSPSSSLVDLPANTSSTTPSEPGKRRLRIIIPDSTTTYGPPSPPHPITALYYPQSGAGDICPLPPHGDISSEDAQFPNGNHHASGASYDKGIRTERPKSKSVRFATNVAQYSPRSPPRLARRSCIPLPPEYSPVDQFASPLDASFKMLTLHDADYASHGSSTSPAIKEHLLPVTNLPQGNDYNLLSPLPLTAAPSYCLTDLQGHISRCLDATERVHLTLASSPLIQRNDALSLCMSLTSAFSGIKEESDRPAPDLEILARAHGAEWRRKYERVILSLDRNLNRFLRVSDEVNSRRPKSRHLVALVENLSWYARKFEDIKRRLEVFHDHISLLEMRAEYQELAVAARAEQDVERAYRKACKAVSEENKTRRHVLKEHIHQQEQDARARWVHTRY